MHNLIDTLLNCPNLSLRLLDSKTGRSVTTLNHEQLQKIAIDQQLICKKDCDNMACINKSFTD